jgi:hypothetical protein
MDFARTSHLAKNIHLCAISFISAKIKLAWDEFMKEFERRSEDRMTELSRTHQEQLSSLKSQVLGTDNSKPKKWSRDLIQCRERQLLMAKRQSYQEAQQTKLVSDALEEKERSKMESTDGLLKRERNLTKKHNAEMDALTKRIDSKRREYVKQRYERCVRLLQRNKNIQSTFDSKHVSVSVSARFSHHLKPANQSFLHKFRQRNVRTWRPKWSNT